MNSIASEARFKHRVMKHLQKLREKGDRHAVRKTANYFRIGLIKSIYDWEKKWDGTWKSLLPISHRPHRHPNQHTNEEIKLIQKTYRECGFLESLLLWQELRERGYTRSLGGMKRFIRKFFNAPTPPKSAKKPKLYHGGTFPGEKLQLDVKFVPSGCVKCDEKLYQFTAVDECSRWCYREIYDEHSTFSSKRFLENLVKAAPFPILKIQTDNGTEWTNALLVTKSKHKSLFEKALAEMKIDYTRIRIATPRHNGRVERQHGLDEKRFYKRNKFYSLAQSREKIAEYNTWSNSRIKMCLGLRSPDTVIAEYVM